MRRSASLLQLALAPLLLQQACALLATPHPHAHRWHGPRSEVSRSSPPLLLAKRNGKKSRGSSAPGDEPPAAAAPAPAGLNVEAALAEAEVLAAEAAAAQARLAAARARAAVAKRQPLVASPDAPLAPELAAPFMVPPDGPFPAPDQQADLTPVPVPSFDEQGAIIRDEPKLTLPSFESYSRGGLRFGPTPDRTLPARSAPPRALPNPPLRRAAPKPLPPLEKFVGKSYESKLPGINQGAKYLPNEDKSEQKPLFERLIFTGTWVRLLPCSVGVRRTLPAQRGPFPLVGRSASSFWC